MEASMKISTKGRYALRIMLDLAMNDRSQLVPLKAIAARQNITVKYMEQIMTPLSRAGFVTSERGANGGYRLSRSPENYRVGDILRVMEGSIVPVACLEDHAASCANADNCVTLSFWRGLQKVIDDYVDSKTLADLKDEYLASQSDFSI